MSRLAHDYLHSLPRCEEERINNGIREYKKKYLECTVSFTDDLPPNEFRLSYTIVKPEEPTKVNKRVKSSSKKRKATICRQHRTEDSIIKRQMREAVYR